jgi:hypothetical protein
MSPVKIMVSKVCDTVEVGANNFKKRELWGRDEGSQYPQDWKFEFVKDKTSLLDEVLEGTFITVHFNLRNNKVEKEDREPMLFTTLQGWKVEV